MTIKNSPLADAVRAMKPAALAELQERCRGVGLKYKAFIDEVWRCFDVTGQTRPTVADIDDQLRAAEDEEAAS